MTTLDFAINAYSVAHAEQYEFNGLTPEIGPFLAGYFLSQMGVDIPEVPVTNKFYDDFNWGVKLSPVNA